MGICADKSVNYLKALNLNVILVPSSDIRPLMLLGEYNGTRAIIGTLDQLVEKTAAALPDITTSTAANINGQRSSKLPISLGLNILGSLLGAMGGNLGVTASYSTASKIDFSYTDVTRYLANIISIGDYLAASSIRWDHLILKKYLFGSGKLYVLTEVVKSAKFGTTAYNDHNAALSLDVPAIGQLAGANVSVGSDGAATTTVTYEGKQQLAFGFAAIELSAGERDNSGEVDLIFNPVPAGATSFSVFGAPASPSPYTVFDSPLVELTEPAPEREPA